MFKRQQQQHDKMRPQGATHQLQLNPVVQGTGGALSQRKSSGASTAADGTDEAPMDRYPMDNIMEKTICELHQSMKNISMKMATGFALPCEPGAR